MALKLEENKIKPKPPDQLKFKTDSILLLIPRFSKIFLFICLPTFTYLHLNLIIRVSCSAKPPAFLTFYMYSTNVFKEGAIYSRDLAILTCESADTSEGLHNELNRSHSKGTYKDSVK